MAVTTKDLAEACGVSRTTVTRALSGTGRISDETKERIVKTAQELGYRPDLLARSLVRGKSMTIGVVLCDLKNMYFPTMINEMEKAAREKDYLLNITLHDNNRVTEKEIIDQLEGHRVDGLILDPASQDKKYYSYLKELPFPVVIVGGDQVEGLAFVGNNESAAAKSAAEFIAGKGYRELFFVFPGFEGKETDFFGGHVERMKGAGEAARSCGMNFSVLKDQNYLVDAVGIVKKFRAAGKKPAFLCSGDIYAGYILLKLMQEGFEPQRDFGIMGFDRLELMQMMPTTLASVENNVETIGQQAVKLLISLMEQKEKPHIIYVPYRVVDGKSL